MAVFPEVTGQFRPLDNSDPWTTQTTQLRPSQLRLPNSDPSRFRPPQFRPLPIQTPPDSDHPNSDPFRFRPPPQFRPLNWGGGGLKKLSHWRN